MLTPDYLTINQSEEFQRADHTPYYSHHPPPHSDFKNFIPKAFENSSLLNTNYLDSLLGTLAIINVTLSFTTTWCQQIGFTVYGQVTHLWISNTRSVRRECKEASHWLDEASHWLNRGQPLA